MNFNVAELVVPEPEHYEVYGHHYSVAPIAGMLAVHCAKEYAQTMISLTAQDICQSAWASSLISDPDLKNIVEAKFNTNNNNLVAEYSKRITRGIRSPKYNMVLGLFDNQTADPHHPNNMVGFCEISLKTAYSKAQDWRIRACISQEVYPSIGPGVILRPDVAIGEGSYTLSDKVFEYALKTFNKTEIGAKYRNSLDFETCEENHFAIEALNLYGDIRQSDYPVSLTSVLGEKPIRLQLQNLKSLIK